MERLKRIETERLSGVVLRSLDENIGATDLARKAYHSRSNFFRLFQALVEENPGAMRRRVLLERAAWQLSQTRRQITEIALDCGYGSLEAFTRAFRRAFQISPSLYRRSGSARFHLPAPNRYHYWPNTTKGTSNSMDLYEIFAGTETWYTKKLLEHAKALTDEQLDRPISMTAKVFPWDKPDRNLREILERMVQTKEVWTAALTGGEMPILDNRPADERKPVALLARFEKAEAEFDGVLRDVRERGAWDESFVDALCEPPETFTYGGMFAHVVTFNAYRRLAALDTLQQLGVSMPSSGCPSEYEAAMKSESVAI